MEYLIDTNIFSDLQFNPDLTHNSYCVSDITFFEILKNKNKKDKYDTFLTAISTMKKHSISFLTKKKRYLKPIYFDNCKTTKRIDEMCIDVSYQMTKNFISFVGAILMSIIAAKNKIDINEDGNMVTLKERDAKFINIISRSMVTLSCKHAKRIAKAIYKQEQNANKQRIEVQLANITIDYYNQFIKDEKYKMNKVDFFNHESLIKKNSIVCSKKNLEKYIKCFISLTNNQENTKLIYLAYAYELVFKGGKIEFNDIVDMNLLSVAISKNKKLLTSDSKVKRVLTQIENDYSLSTHLSVNITIKQ